MPSDHLELEEVAVFNGVPSAKEQEEIGLYMDSKHSFGIKEKILVLLFPRQYPHLLKVKQFRKKLGVKIHISDETVRKL